MSTTGAGPRPAGGRPSLVELITQIHDSLAAGGIGHAFGGALALAYHVRDPRTTRDVDINISAPPDHAAEVFGHLPRSVAWDDADAARVGADGQVRLWSGPRGDGTPVDLFFPQHRFHDELAGQATERTFARPGYTIPVISASHLAVLKVMFDRPKDWIDVASMLEAGTVDVAQVTGWLERILGQDHPSLPRWRSLAAAPSAAGREAPASPWSEEPPDRTGKEDR